MNPTVAARRKKTGAARWAEIRVGDEACYRTARKRKRRPGHEGRAAVRRIDDEEGAVPAVQVAVLAWLPWLPWRVSPLHAVMNPHFSQRSLKAAN
ncbi:hypothetical protein [Herbaspirillum frisingense]|uniref:hypothetical protein n=1 Tax=Herbaspirillum frisingense TaxID=92645 RepID=UPI0039AFD6A8